MQHLYDTPMSTQWNIQQFTAHTYDHKFIHKAPKITSLNKTRYLYLERISLCADFRKQVLPLIYFRIEEI